MYKLLVIGLVFLLGFYFIYKSNDIEAFTTDIGEKCPDILIQKGAAFFLYNSKRANVPGVNPIRFENLEEYVEFTEWQRSQGILCPVLYLQQSFDTQNNQVYKARPSPTDMLAGFPDLQRGGAQDQMKRGNNEQSLMNFKPLLNSNSDGTDIFPGNMPAFDAHDQSIGDDGPIDKMFNQTAAGKWSPNPMDDNWGGAAYTDALIDAGYYKDNEVVRGVGS